jgi:hypothetical protein
MHDRIKSSSLKVLLEAFNQLQIFYPAKKFFHRHLSKQHFLNPHLYLHKLPLLFRLQQLLSNVFELTFGLCHNRLLFIRRLQSIHLVQRIRQFLVLGE